MQTPWWMSLLGALTAALIGAVAAIYGQSLTQKRTDRRENARWERERVERREQWQREDTARQDQWQREDDSRWHADRRAVYGQAIAAIEEWARYAIPWALEPQALEEGSTAVLKALGAATIVARPEAMEQMRIIGAGVIAVSTTSQKGSEMPETPGGISLAGIVGDGARLLASRLLDTARADLDIEPAPSDRTIELTADLRHIQDLWIQGQSADTELRWATMTSSLLATLVGDPDESEPIPEKFV